jgi:L-ribulokinase
MKQKKDSENYLIGIDFGTDSVRSIILDDRGRQIANAVHYYSRWEKGLYCNSSKNQFRHHPKDYLEGLESVLKKVVTGISDEIVQQIKGISVDTTGSTPVAVDRAGSPLALTGGLEDNPNAMFILWKDHTAVQEAGEITELAHSWNGRLYQICRRRLFIRVVLGKNAARTSHR